MNKKIFMILIIIGIIILTAAAALIIYELTADGAQTPETAIWKYEKAAMTYDASNMVKYSSSYNRYELNRRSFDYTKSSLKKYLNKIYDGINPMYTDENLDYKIISIKYITKDTQDFDDLYRDYTELYPKEEPKEFCKITMDISQNNKHLLRFNGIAVKIGSRWFYFKA